MGRPVLSAYVGSGAGNEGAEDRPETPRALTTEGPERRCRRCGEQAIADENRCRECGSFLPGNLSGLVHGQRRQTQADPAESELYQAWAADLGGFGELTAGQRAVLARAVEADAIAQTAFDYLSRTREGIGAARVQSAISALATAANLTFRAAKLLGLERRAAPAETLDQALARAAREHEQKDSQYGEPEAGDAGREQEAK